MNVLDKYISTSFSHFQYTCGHRCVENCHSGPCPNPEACSKKVKVFCKCKRIKKDFPCIAVRTGTITVDCDNVCRKIKEEQDKQREIEMARKRQEEEARNQLEVEKFERKFKPRRKGKGRTQMSDDLDTGRSSLFKKAAAAVGILLIAISCAVFYANERMQFFK